VGHDISFFTKPDQATPRARSFLLLQIKANNQPKRRANRASARRERNQKGNFFRFPKKLLATPSTLSIDDNELKFVSQAGTTQINASDLRKMVDQ
jgi:hypothetical protein